MSNIKDRLLMLREMRRKHLHLLRLHEKDRERDKDGSASNSLSGTLRFLAVADYIIDKDIKSFKDKISESSVLRCKLFDRFESGEKISPSYVSMISYKALLNVLASGDEGIARCFSERIGGRVHIEKEYDRPFDIAIGYSIKYIVLSDFPSASPWVDKLDALCREEENVDFLGYAKVLRALLGRDRQHANYGLIDIVAGHKRQIFGNGLFKDTEDELLCVWGVAMANLARMHGIQVDSVEPLIPSDLLV
jgi:hypothetical protein